MDASMSIQAGVQSQNHRMEKCDSEIARVLSMTRYDIIPVQRHTSFTGLRGEPIDSDVEPVFKLYQAQ